MVWISVETGDGLFAVGFSEEFEFLGQVSILFAETENAEERLENLVNLYQKSKWHEKYVQSHFKTLR